MFYSVAVEILVGTHQKLIRSIAPNNFARGLYTRPGRNELYSMFVERVGKMCKLGVLQPSENCSA